MKNFDILTHANPRENMFITNRKSWSLRSDGYGSPISGRDNRNQYNYDNKSTTTPTR